MITEFNQLELFEYIESTLAGVSIITGLAGLIHIIHFI